MKEKYTPPQEEMETPEKEKRKQEEPNFKRDIQSVQKNLNAMQNTISRLADQNNKYIDVLESGTPEEQKAFADELIEGSKRVEAENKRMLKETFDRFDEEVERAKKEEGLGMFLNSQWMNVSCSTFDSYLIEDKPLEKSIEYYFNGAKLMKKLIEIAEENGIDYITFQSAQSDINYLGRKLIERIQKEKSSMSKEEKEKIISEVRSLVKIRKGIDFEYIRDFFEDEKKKREI